MEVDSAGEAGDEGNSNDAAGASESDLENVDNKSLAARRDSEQLELIERRERLASSLPSNLDYGTEVESPGVKLGLEEEANENGENQNDEDVYNASRNSDTSIEDSGSLQGAVTELGWKPSRLKKNTV